MTFEWAYNLQDACVRYQHDPRIGLFHGILSGEVGTFLENINAVKCPLTIGLWQVTSHVFVDVRHFGRQIKNSSLKANMASK